MMELADVGQTFRETVFDGPLLLAVPVAALAGLISFLSPCVLPLVPGYLSFITGLSGADAEAEGGRRRVLLGGVLFVLGFSVVFVAAGALFGGLGSTLQRSTLLRNGLGVVTILLGLVFMGALRWVPVLNREVRLHRAIPATSGLAAAPALGLFFGLGWTPCIGPTLGAVLTLSVRDESATAARGSLLAFVYCLGLGLPFILSGLAFRRAVRAFAVVRRHQRTVMRLGGAFLIVLGLLQVTGVYDRLVLEMKQYINKYETVV
jgi:cytochrome c-type biogenesis protein